MMKTPICKISVPVITIVATILSILLIFLMQNFPETGNDRNCAGCRTCCLDYACWLKTQDILFAIINDTFFDVIVTLCIILNTIFLAIEHHGMSEELGHILDLGNKVFTTFFALEAVLKLAALSREYFGNGWNIFDLVTWNQNIILTMIMIIIFKPIIILIMIIMASGDCGREFA